MLARLPDGGGDRRPLTRFPNVSVLVESVKALAGQWVFFPLEIKLVALFEISKDSRPRARTSGVKG